MSESTQGLARSVHDRLVRHAKMTGVNPNLVLARFGVERFLYRLSRSPHGDRFVLKGALLLLVWLGETIRPTRDADLLGFGDLSDEGLAAAMREACEMDVESDGVSYDPSSIRIAAIRLEDPYGGKRVTLEGRLGKARLHLQVDVGIGDAVFPEPEWLDYPSLLGFPGPHLRAYRPETAIAEKVHAMVVLGMKNSRMRDFFDIRALAEHESFDGRLLVQALRTTFERRGTPIPETLPVGLTREFAETAEKRAQWQGFLRRSSISPAPPELVRVVGELARFLAPVLAAGAGSSAFDAVWRPRGPWETAP